MEDYSDKTLRALIRQLIAEDKVNDYQPPKTDSDNRALLTTQAFLGLSKFFSVKGFAALTVMGLIFEPEFTSELVEFGLDQFEDFGSAITVFVEKKNEPFFLRLAEASAHMKDKSRKNKYLLLNDMKKLADEDGNFLASNFNKVFASYNSYNVAQADVNDLTADDKAIYEGINNGDISELFTPGLFKIDDKTGTVVIVDHDSSKSYSDAKTDYEKKMDNAKVDGRYIDKLLIQAIAETHEQISFGDSKEQAKERAANARIIYDNSIKIQNENANEIDKKMLFSSMDDLEEGVATDFDIAIGKVTGFFESKFDDKIKEASESIADKIGDKIKDLF